MAEFESCDKCRYSSKSDNEYPCNKCVHSATDKFKPKTNADKIRSMNDEELAEFFSILDHSCLNGECFICFGVNYIPDNERSILDWLQSEAE